MTLMHFDPFRDLERLTEQAFGYGRGPRALPMEALRRGDGFLIALDVPGVQPSDVDVSVERNVVTVRAHREPLHNHGDELIVDERPTGDFSRQLFLGENLDAGELTAEFSNGVLLLRIPVAEASKPRKVEIASRGGDSRTIKTGSAEPSDAAETGSSEPADAAQTASSEPAKA
jgi:HSP20 family protein